MTVQLSLLDGAGDGDDGSVPALAGRVERTGLARGAWVDTCAGWLPGTADLFDALADLVPWRSERRQMYERIVDVPRLVCFLAATRFHCEHVSGGASSLHSLSSTYVVFGFNVNDS